MSPQPAAWQLGIGLAFAVLGPLFPLYRLGILLWRIVTVDEGAERTEADRRHRPDLPFIVGVIERILYTAAWLLRAPEFIGIWLALKVAGGWNAWSEGVELQSAKATTVKIAGRHIFNIFLINSAVSLANALAGALIVLSYASSAPEQAVLILTWTVALTYGLWVWAEFRWIWQARKAR